MNDRIKDRHILLVDGHGLAFRGFYALPEMNAPDGTPTNAVMGFMNMLLKARAEWSPDSVVIFFDPHGPTARDEMYGEYKDGRAPTPDAFKVQLPIIMRLAELLGYPVCVRDGIEADDLIASTARSIDDAGGHALILSADKDLLQILRGRIAMARPTRGVSEFRLYDEASFTEEYGFEPKAMADYLALVGDSVDNIPGVAGIGDKTARTLLAKYGSLDSIYEHVGELAKGTAAKLTAGRGDAELSMKLVLPIDVEPIAEDDLAMREQQSAEAAELCGRYGLRKLADRLGIEMKASPRTPVVISLPRDELYDGLVAISLDDVGTMEAADADGVAQIDAADLRERLVGDRVIVLANYREWLRVMPTIKAHQARIFDVELAHYFMHPDARSHDARDFIGDGAPTCDDMATYYRACAASEHFDDMTRVMSEIDVPLVPVLAALGNEGLRVDAERMHALGRTIASDIARIEREIYDAAGGVINLNSPKQVGELLFEHLRLPVIKKTKSGYSTDASVLEELAALPEPMCDIPSRLLDFRERSKMLTGFVEPFIKYAEASADSRVRSTFLHDATGTGRLASRDPNVQNIPVFGELATEFRKAIVPRDGCVFVAADYSQIELRVLAHLSGEERLAEAFAGGRDVHLETASWVFGLDPSEVTPEQRRFAKTVNFGLIYGMGAHGLSTRLGITRNAAAQMIERYFDALPRVKHYLADSAREAKARGYTRSFFGRIRPLDEVSTTVGRGGASIDRVAVNTPIQSTASDIAKLAMIALSSMLAASHSGIRFVLQVHDSLVCEAPIEAADEAEALLVRVMEAQRAIDIPLVAEPKRGATLADV